MAEREDIIFNGENLTGNKESNSHVYIFNVKEGHEDEDIFPEVPQKLLELAEKVKKEFKFKK